MAKKQSGGSSKNSADSRSRRLGMKCYPGQIIKAGGIILRQVGHNYKSGKNTVIGRDFTINSTIDGVVNMKLKRHSINKQKKIKVLEVN